MNVGEQPSSDPDTGSGVEDGEGEHFLSWTVSAMPWAAENAKHGNRRKAERTRQDEELEVEGNRETLGFVVDKKRVGEEGEKIDIVCV